MTPDAFAVFYEQAFPEVYRYVFRAVLGNRALAEDLTQETFVTVVAAVHDGRAEIHSMPWMIAVARHKLIDHYRHAECEQRRLTSLWSSGSGRVDDDLDDLDVQDPDHAIELLRNLLPAHRLVLVLRYLDDLSVNEIARSLGRSVRATESLLVRARRELARNYREIDA